MFLLNLLFPERCGGCNRWGDYLCAQCLKTITQTELVCPNCERPAMGGLTHPLCQKRFGLDGLWSLGSYQDPLRLIIQKLKYRYVSSVAETLINLLLDYWAKYSPKVLEEIKKDRGESWMVVPVPLHPKRQKFRGFNQSALLGKLLSKKIDLSYGEALKRVRHTKSQVSLKSWQRRKNIRGAFALTKNYHLTPNILLIDDVWTTGSTLKECCYILKRGGAKKVWAITLAK